MLLNAKSVFNNNNYIAMSWQVTFRLDDDDEDDDDDDDMRFLY